MTSHEVEKFIIENYPTMDMDDMVLSTGMLSYRIRNIAYKHGVYRHKKSPLPQTPPDGSERCFKETKYIKHEGRWMSYIRYVWELHNGRLRKGQSLVLKDPSKDITIDNIGLYRKKYAEPHTDKEVDFVKKVCSIVGVEYDDKFLTNRKGIVPMLKKVICSLHKEMYEATDGISVRQSRIGTAIGRDRTMVIVYENRHNDDYRFNPEYRKLYEKVKENL